MSSLMLHPTSLLMSMFITFSSSASFAKSCFKVTDGLSNNLKSLVFEIPNEDSKNYFIKVVGREKNDRQWENKFYCISLTEGSEVKCVGDDDSGSFAFHREGKILDILVEFIQLGDPDNPSPLIRRPDRKNPLRLSGIMTACQ